MKNRFIKNQFTIAFSPETSQGANHPDDITAGDFFAGGGGVTRALYNMPGVKVKWVLNHDRKAINTNMFHHKGVKHYWADIFVQDEHEMEPVHIIWASIECTQHSQAKGGGDKDIGSYMMGWELVRYLKYLKPLVIGIENVPEFKKWAPLDKFGKPDKARLGEEFERWKKTIMDMGYQYKESIRNAADDGLPTRRVRYFAFFYREGIEIEFPEFTHNKDGSDGKQKWQACRKYIDVDNHGISIFGRKYNEELPKHLRKALCKNTLRRIAGGIKKYSPEFNTFICQYYGTDQVQKLDDPLNTVTTKDRHQLINFRGQSLESPLNTVTVANRHQLIHYYYGGDGHVNKLDKPINAITTVNRNQLITQDYGGSGARGNSVNAPINTIAARNVHRLITLEKLQFIQDHCHTANYNLPDEPLNPQLTRQTKQFVSAQYNSNGYPESNNHSIESPLPSVTTREKLQFISSYFNSNGKPGSQNQSVDAPLNTILTGANKKALISMLNDFDIKARFLTKEELAACSTFPRDYFSKFGLNLSNKDAIKLIGNAVPPEWARILIAPAVKAIREYKQITLWI